MAFMAATVYVGIQFGRPYYQYETFKTEAKEIARIELGDVEKTRAKIYESAQSFNIPVKEKDILVTKKANLVQVKTAWSAEVDIFGLYQRTLHFTLDIEA